MVLLHKRIEIKRMGDGVYTHIEINDLISAKIQTYSFGKLIRTKSYYKSNSKQEV